MIASRELDRKQFFQPIVETINLTLKLPACIWLADATREVLWIVAATGLSDDYVRKAVLRLDEPSAAADVFTTGQTIVVTDIAADDRWQYKAEAAAMGLKSAMVIPLRVKRKVVGVLDVYTHEVREFSEFEKALTEDFATQIAVTRRRIRDLAVLNEMSLWISSELHPSELFKRIVQAAERVLDCEHVSVFLADKSGDLVLETASSAGIARQRFVQGVGLAGWVAQTKRSELVPDAVKHPQFVPGKSSELIERSMVLTPMLFKDKVIGVISADMDGLSGFDEHDQVLLEAVASQSAVAVRNVRLLEQATSRATALRRLHQIGGQVLSAELSVHGLREVLRQVARSAKSVLGADLVDVYQYVEAEDRYVLPPVLEGERRDTTVPRVPKWIFDDDVVVRVVEGGESLYSPDAQIAPLLSSPFTVERPERPERRFVVREGILSSAAVPLKAAGETVGVMFVNYRTRQDFSSGQREIIELFANQAAMAIYNARVYEQIQARDERLRTLVEVGQALTSEIHLPQDEILESIYEQARWLTGTQDMYIALYDDESNLINFGLAMEAGKRAKVGVGGWAPREANLEERGKTEGIILAKEPILHRTLEESTKWYKEPGHKEFLGRVQPSYLGVPMILGNRVLGVIAIYDWEREYAYDKQDQQAISSMASQAAIALDNARLYYDVNQRLEDTNQGLEDANRGLERRVKDLDALNRVGQVLSSSVQLKQIEVLESIYEQARRLTGTQDMYIALYDDKSNMINFGLAMEAGKRAEVGVGGWAPREANLEERGKTEEIILAKEPILHRTLEESTKWYKEPGHKEFLDRVATSWMGVPMVLGDRILGVIAIYDWEREYAYDEQYLQVISSMASQAAIALDNARLFEETRKLQDEVVAAKQLATLGTAIAALEHRINNTFNIIVPNVTRLRKRVDLTDETIMEILDIIERNARYTSDIIARIQEPLREIEPQDVDVNAVLNEVVGKVRELWRTDSTQPLVEVILSLDDSIPLIRAPIGQVAEVFRNLVDNAYRAMKEGGQLIVASHLTDDTIHVRVQDTGPGIPPQVRQRLFVKPVPSKEPGGGAGLGLWLSRLMLQSMGGDVKIEKSASTGTTMLVQIQ